MCSLLSRKLQTEISLCQLKLISSVAASKSSIVVSNEYEAISTPFDSIHFFSEYSKSGQCTVKNTKIFHAQLLRKYVLQPNTFVANTLLDCYCKSATMVNALKLFDSLTNPNVVSWNIMISGYNQNSLFLHSWEVYCRMHSSRFEPNERTYANVLSTCCALQAPICGKLVYSVVIKNGFYSNGFVRSGMIDLFAKNCSFGDSLRVFHDVSCQNAVCWNSIISGAVRNEENRVALDVFCQMGHRFLVPNSYTFSSVLTACAALGDIVTGKGIHGWVIKCDAEDIFVGTALVDLYAKCGEMDEAIKTFKRMPGHNVVSWTAVISGFVQKDDPPSALNVFRDMIKAGVEINNYTLTSVITACANLSMTIEAIQIHALILKSGYCLDSSVGAALINMYAKVGAVDLSKMIFEEVKHLKSPGSWAAMASSYAQNQNSRMGWELFCRMLREGLRPDMFCTSSVLSIIDCLNLGRQINCYTLKTGLGFHASVGCSLLTMYSKGGSLEESYKVFEEIPDKDKVSWASMIAGFVEHGFADRALQLYREMLFAETIPDQMTLVAVLTACSVGQFLKIGKGIHGYALRAGYAEEATIGGLLVNMYSKCGKLESARRFFELLPQKNKVACSSLVSGYAQNRNIEEAVNVFHILMVDLTIDSFTVSSILRATALLNRPSIGIQLHACSTKLGLDSDVSVGSSMLMMYSKCGSLEDCCKAFNQIKELDLIGWTAMIMSYAQHGKGAEALKVYEVMKKEGIKPDPVTFVAILSACSHNGMVEEAYFHFHSMKKDYTIEPGYPHYTCMVDLLGRAGRLKEAKSFIDNMPIEPDALVWGTLLAACKVQGDIELGKLAAKKVMNLKPSDAGAYVSLSNICADVGQWEEVLKIRSQMKRTGVEKEPGWSIY